MCLCVCVCRCLCTVHRFTRSSTCSIQRMEDREAGSQSVSVVLLSRTCVLQKETRSTSSTVQYPFFGKMHCCPESLALSSNRIYSKPRMVLYKSVFALIGKLWKACEIKAIFSRDLPVSINLLWEKNRGPMRTLGLLRSSSKFFEVLRR